MRAWPTCVRPRFCAASSCSTPRTRSSWDSGLAAPWRFVPLDAGRARLDRAGRCGPISSPPGLGQCRRPGQGRAAGGVWAIAALDAGYRASRILEVVQAIKQKYDNLNLTVWGRGLARVATRLALADHRRSAARRTRRRRGRWTRPRSTTCWPLPCRWTTSTCAEDLGLAAT
jgi:hypothetical protein